MSDQIPARFNEAAVLRYQKVMEDVCANWPEPVLVNPAPLSMETFRSRFRDAMKGSLVWSQGPDSLRGKLMMLSEPVVVSEHNGLLRIGPKSMPRIEPENALQAGLIVSGVATLADHSEAYKGPERAIVEAIALLTSVGILSGARVEGVSEEFIYSCFPEDYEGGVVVNKDGTLTIY